MIARRASHGPGRPLHDSQSHRRPRCLVTGGIPVLEDGRPTHYPHATLTWQPIATRNILDKQTAGNPTGAQPPDRTAIPRRGLADRFPPLPVHRRGRPPRPTRYVAGRRMVRGPIARTPCPRTLRRARHNRQTRGGTTAMKRLTGTDALFLSMEAPSWHQHVGGLTILEPGDPQVTYEDIVRTIEARLGAAPKFRWKLKTMPLGLD